MVHRVLIADDEPKTAHRIASFLRQEPDLDTAVTSQISDFRHLLGFDLVITDIVWPARARPRDSQSDNFGLEAMAFLRTLAPDAKVILMSKYLFDLEELERIQAADAFFKSESSAEVVVDTVRRILGSSSSNELFSETPAFVRQSAAAPRSVSSIYDAAQLVEFALRSEPADGFAMTRADAGTAITLAHELQTDLRAGRFDQSMLRQRMDQLAAATRRADNVQRVLNRANERLDQLDQLPAIFISYAKDDAPWMIRLQKSLAPYEYKQRLTVWSDPRIAPGSKWEPEIEAALAKSKCFVALVSTNYLASSFVSQHELPAVRALDEAERGKLFWILVGHCAYEVVGLDEIQAAHDIKRPLATLDDASIDGVLTDVCRSIARYLS